jgi:hypothetical protein
MRHSTLVASAMVLLGVGMVTARLGAQAARTPPDLAVEGILKSEASAILSRAFQEQKLKDALRERETLAPSWPAVDCAMPMIKVESAIDPKFLKELPSDRVKHSLRVILVPKCAQ